MEMFELKIKEHNELFPLKEKGKCGIFCGYLFISISVLAIWSKVKVCPLHLKSHECPIRQ